MDGTAVRRYACGEALFLRPGGFYALDVRRIEVVTPAGRLYFFDELPDFGLLTTGNVVTPAGRLYFFDIGVLPR